MGSKSSSGSSGGPPPPAVYSLYGQQYLDNNPDVAATGVDPWAHWNEFGRSEGRTFGPESLTREADNADYLERYADVAEAGVDPFAHYLEFGQAEGRTYGSAQLSDDPIQAFLDMQQEAAATARSARASELAALEQQREEDRITFGENQRDSYYNDYLSAANSATDYVNSTIASEQANADLLGIEYSITEEGKQERINNYFSSLWTEGDQSEIEKLFAEFGEVENFGGFTVTRGEDSAAESDALDRERTPTTSSGIRPTRGGAPSRRSIATGSNKTLGSLATLGGG